MCSCVVAATLSRGGYHDSQAKHPAAKHHMAEGSRDSCIQERCPLTVYSACNNKISNSFFPETFQKGWVAGSRNPGREKDWCLCEGVI